VLETAHGPVETPVFMPVGTQATVKALSSADLARLGPQMILGNTYHLALRPGAERIAALGGLHKFMAWPGAILTDSGGYQVFSLRDRAKIDDDGVTFRSHLDGSEQRLTPARAMEIQELLGSDVAMAFDHCPPSDAPRASIEDAMARTTTWAARCVEAPRAEGQLRFGIVQGGVHLDLRRRHLGELTSMPFEGYALGGLGVGEAPVRHVRRHRGRRARDARGQAALPHGRRHAQGHLDVDRRWHRHVRLRDADAQRAQRPALHARRPRQRRERALPRRSGAHRSRLPVRVLQHLQPRVSVAPIRAEELLFYRLATAHNLQHYLDLARRAREAIRAGAFPAEPW